jgi:hypothetical protein
VTWARQFPGLLEDAGLHVEVMDFWDKPHLRRGKPYLWRTGNPEASMWHHTASGSYTPNRLKANMYAGLTLPGDPDFRLHQSGGGEPTIVFANAHPGPITSGYGQKSVLELAQSDIQNDARATGPDDDWAGNKSYWNTEIVLDGVGSWIDTEVWDMLIVAGAVIHDHMGWSEYRAIGHIQHTRRKPDPWDGQDPNAIETMIRFRGDLAAAMQEDGMATLEQFVEYIRDTDIVKMGDDGIITATEVTYFTTGDPWPGGIDKVVDHPDWNNLYLAWKVRAPIWAV